MNEDTLPYLLCELANSHAGDVRIVEQLIDVFGSLDYPRKGIKFQIFSADTIALPDFSWYPVYQTIEFPPEIWAKFIDIASRRGDVWIDVFDRYGVAILGSNLGRVRGLKLQASVLENDEVISSLSSLDLRDKQFLINISGHNLETIARFVEVFRVHSPHLILQAGFQAYPTEIADTALQKIPLLMAEFPQLEVGIADHADGGTDFAQLAPLYAVAMGCRHVEKHLCISRASARHDGFSALEPCQMQQLCDRLKALTAASVGAFVGASELNYLTGSVQVPILRHACVPGQRLNPQDFLYRRTSQTGLSWRAIDELQRGRTVIARNADAACTLSTEDFKRARVAVIVACRMKSARLARKALLPVDGVPSVERCLYQCLAVNGVDRVILATSTLAEDAILQQYDCSGLVHFWAGDPDDVIARYLGACEHYGIDTVVRVTADCPLVSPEIIEHLLESHFIYGADYTAANRSAVGTAGEVMNVHALRIVIDRLGRAEHSEYMTWYFRNNPDVFRINLVDLPDAMVRAYRLTLDYQEDLEMMEALYKRLPSGTTAKALDGVFEILDTDPVLAASNSHIELKYVADQELINMLNEKTRLWPRSVKSN